MATLIAVLIAMFTFGLNRGRSMDQINDTLVSSIKIIAMMLLIVVVAVPSNRSGG